MQQADTGYILGEVIPAIVEPNLVIVNAITQEFYGTDRVHVDYDAVRQAMKGVEHLAKSKLIESTDVHFPLIGGGLAGGDQFKLVELFGDCWGASDINAKLWLYTP
jgi:O-acetyl-ADP-ribose deacetylase (regulator of RNase III)